MSAPGPVGGRAAPARRRDHDRARDDRTTPRLPGAHRVVHAQPARGRARRRSTPPSPAHAGWRMLSIVDRDRLRRLLGRMLDPDEFLSDHGIRALSKWHQAHPLQLDLDGSRDDARLRARRVDERALRRQLELARAGLDADQLPADRVPPRVRAVSGPDLPRRVPDGLGRRARPRRDRGLAHRPADRACSCATPTGGGRSSATTRCCRRTRPGAT